jgi:hypothetical protein|tara:strand:+ start:3403 stop:3924 length:522 start_codon:yes stop_codon:yes gene_type:complete
MNYLYHKVPEDMKGNFLMPLNSLKKKYPSIYNEKVKKYEGRETLLNLKFPILNCLWNDVIHLTAVNPEKLKKALIKAGSPKRKKSKWFKIDPRILNKSITIVNLYKIRNLFNEKNYIFFQIRDLDKYNKIGSKTKAYFREEFSMGRKPMVFHFIPHILYKGKINIKDCEVIEV